MNIDRWNVVNVLATRVANFYVPGLDVSALSEKPDPEPAQAQKLLQMLAAVASGRDSAMLVDGLRRPGTATRLPAGFGFGGEVQRFTFLEREDLGARGQERFGSIIRWLYRYKLVSPAGIIYYTFELTPKARWPAWCPKRSSEQLRTQEKKSEPSCPPRGENP